MPKVSIITPCYNSRRFIVRTIASVIDQSFGDWEHVVVDDGSTDDPAAVVGPYLALEPRLRLIHQSNRGVCGARNQGLRAAAAESEYLLFLDADDCLEPDMLAVMVAYLERHTEVGLVHCKPSFIDEEDRTLEGFAWPPRWAPAGRWVRTLPEECAETPLVSILCLAGLIPSLSLMRRSVYEQTPGWDEGMGWYLEDTDLFLQLALRGKVHYLPRALVRHRRHRGQSTADPARFPAQERKLYTKWRRGVGLTEAQRQVVAEALRFRETRLIPYQALRAGGRHLRAGSLFLAARFYVGGLRRYAASLLPVGWRLDFRF
jgi:glycosyltransferase involved in cell wall biosynthesis